MNEKKVTRRFRKVRPEEREMIIKKVLQAYHEALDEKEEFEFQPDFFVILESLENGVDMMGAVAIHVPTQKHPLPTIKYFGLENLQNSEPILKLEESMTVEGCRQAAFGQYRGKGYNTSALLMIASWVYAKGCFNSAHMLATQQEWLRDYTRKKIGIPLISPRLPLIGRPKTNAEGVFWETNPVPLIIPLEPALFAQCWRLLEERGMNGRLLFEDCPCPDPLLQSYFPTS